jgi:hypothetical protein
MDPATQCVAWSDCKAGTVIVPPPASRVTDRICSACTTGTFSAAVNATAECKAWTVCKAGFEVTATPSASVDRGCTACRADEYSTGDNAANCTKQPVCAAGFQQTAAGTTTTPTKCDTCKAGEYCAGDTTAPVACGPETKLDNYDHDSDPATPCVKLTQCEKVLTEGTPTKDRVCAPIVVTPDGGVPLPKTPGPPTLPTN